MIHDAYFFLNLHHELYSPHRWSFGGPPRFRTYYYNNALPMFKSCEPLLCAGITFSKLKSTSHASMGIKHSNLRPVHTLPRRTPAYPLPHSYFLINILYQLGQSSRLCVPQTANPSILYVFTCALYCYYTRYCKLMAQI